VNIANTAKEVKKKTTAEEPVCFPPQRAGIPAAMKAEKRWVVFKQKQRKDGTWHKPPLFGASSTDPKTWLTFDEAMAYVERGEADGVAFASGDGWVILDFDGCVRRPKSRKGAKSELDKMLPPVVVDAMNRFNSHTTISPSGMGVHIVMKVPQGYDAKISEAKPEGCEKFEIFDGEHFCSETGLPLGVPRDVATVEVEELEAWLAPFRGQRTKKGRAANPESTGTDEQILERVGRSPKYAKLIAGDRSDYDDDSKADFALGCAFASHTHLRDQWRRLMEGTGLKRDKWYESRPEGDWLESLFIETTAKQPLETRRNEYQVRDDDTVYMIGPKGNPIRLANFVPSITETLTVDQGDRSETQFSLKIRHAGREQHATGITPEETGKTTFIRARFGGQMPKAGTDGLSAEHTWRMIQELSDESQIKKRIVLLKLGRYDGATATGVKGFVSCSGLHTAGELDASIIVKPEQFARRYVLPGPPQGVRCIEAVRASLELRNLRSKAIMVPLLSLTYGAALGDPRLMYYLHGVPGTAKTTTLCCATQHYGVDLNIDNLVATFDDTNTALKTKAASLPLLLIDDVKGSKIVKDTRKSRCEEMAHAYGDGHGKDRCRETGEVRPTQEIRGGGLATGEFSEFPESALVRMVVPPPATRDDLDVAKYHAAQSNAHLYAEAMSAYIQWLDPRLDECREYVRTRIADFERREQSKGIERHARYAKNTGKLVAWWELLTRFALEVGAIDADQKRAMDAEAERVIVEVIDNQSQTAQAHPPTLLLNLLRLACASGRWRLVAVGEEPKVDRKLLGWVGDSPFDRLGFVVGDMAYLIPEFAIKAAQSMPGGDSLSVDKGSMGAHLHTAGLLTKIEKDATGKIKQYDPKVTIPGGHGRPRVWCLKLASVVDASDDEKAKF
jgi:hypothetical protein